MVVGRHGILFGAHCKSEQYTEEPHPIMRPFFQLGTPGVAACSGHTIQVQWTYNYEGHATIAIPGE